MLAGRLFEIIDAEFVKPRRVNSDWPIDIEQGKTCLKKYWFYNNVATFLPLDLKRQKRSGYTFMWVIVTHIHVQTLRQFRSHEATSAPVAKAFKGTQVGRTLHVRSGCRLNSCSSEIKRSAGASRNPAFHVYTCINETIERTQSEILQAVVSTRHRKIFLQLKNNQRVKLTTWWANGLYNCQQLPEKYQTSPSKQQGSNKKKNCFFPRLLNSFSSFIWMVAILRSTSSFTPKKNFELRLWHC